MQQPLHVFCARISEKLPDWNRGNRGRVSEGHLRWSRRFYQSLGLLTGKTPGILIARAVPTRWAS